MGLFWSLPSCSWHLLHAALSYRTCAVHRPFLWHVDFDVVVVHILVLFRQKDLSPFIFVSVFHISWRYIGLYNPICQDFIFSCTVLLTLWSVLDCACPHPACLPPLEINLVSHSWHNTNSNWLQMALLLHNCRVWRPMQTLAAEWPFAAGVDTGFSHLKIFKVPCRIREAGNHRHVYFLPLCADFHNNFEPDTGRSTSRLIRKSNTK